MRNYIQPGHAITLAAPYDVVSGAGLLVGSIFGVASHDALSGAEVETSSPASSTSPRSRARPGPPAPRSTGTTPRSASPTSPRATRSSASRCSPSARGADEIVGRVRLNGAF